METIPLCDTGPILTADGLKEYSAQEIINSRQCGWGWQFLVHWLGYGPQHNLWIATFELNECEALNMWYSLVAMGRMRGSFSPTVWQWIYTFWVFDAPYVILLMIVFLFYIITYLPRFDSVPGGV
jgi:hypothetical protein